MKQCISILVAKTFGVARKIFGVKYFEMAHQNILGGVSFGRWQNCSVGWGGNMFEWSHGKIFWDGAANNFGVGWQNILMARGGQKLCHSNIP